MKTRLRTYGKQNKIKKILLEVKNRFKINKIAREILNEYQIGVYVPKLNKPRFIVGLIAAVICIATPVITPLSIPAILWGIK